MTSLLDINCTFSFQDQSKDEDDDEGDRVTYSTSKTSSSPEAPVATTDPSDLYATVNKPNR